LKTAARLFATQGFEATTTIQLAREAGVTEPLIYYHFKGKDDLFTHIIGATFSEYFSRRMNPDPEKSLREAAVNFCLRSLINNTA
ncbi:MAG: helix-turn-helix transcriptional regulator, partial [bacterium]|nr:helix-turn-helix transcriptional regulator [bacterium]